MSLFKNFEEQQFFSSEILQVLQREVHGFRNIPTHTEDGIPIRKLYVTNLPPKTTRTDLFGIFAPYGFIKSCWLRMNDDPHRISSPTYAFITFSNPEDAHKALLAPPQEKMLRGRSLRIYPADSWHQPVEETDVKPQNIYYRGNRKLYKKYLLSRVSRANACQSSTKTGDASNSQMEATTSEQVVSKEVSNADNEDTVTILDVLNTDCLEHILSFVPIRDVIRSERVSKRWQFMVQEYLQGVRTFKSSWWRRVPLALTTAVLRRVLSRLALTRLHIDHPWSALNDRTAHAIGKFCPDLEDLKVIGMQTKNWNPVIYGCKKLKNLTFISCNRLTDSSLVHLVKHDSSIESLEVANNTHITGLFLTGANPHKLTSLSFHNCYSIQGMLLTAAMDSLPNLKCLKIDACPVTIWKKIPEMLYKLLKLEEISFCEFTSIDVCLMEQYNKEFCESFSRLKELKHVYFSKNIYITNDMLKSIAQASPNLMTLNVYGCNARRGFPFLAGVGDEGINAICKSCNQLERLDVSYLSGLTDAGLANVNHLPLLRDLLVKGNRAVTSEPFQQAVTYCHLLEYVDACGCENVSDNLLETAMAAMALNPRKLILNLGGTAIQGPVENVDHKLLILNLSDDRSNLNFRAEFVDRILDDSSDDSILGGLLDDDDMHDFIDHDDLFLDDYDDYDDYDDDDDNKFYYGVHY